MMFLAAAPSTKGAVGTMCASMSLRLKSWIAARAERGATDSAAMPDAAEAVEDNSTIVAFPGTVDVGLSRLMSDLRVRFVSLGRVDIAPFILAADPVSRHRFWVDETTYIETRGPRAGYRVVLDDAFDMRMTVETHDLQSVESLIGHYIVARLVDADADYGGDAA